MQWVIKVIYRMFSPVPCTALAIGLALTQAGAEPENWMRDEVRTFELRWLQQAIGEDAYQELLATDPEIIGGKTAPPGKWPAQVALLNASIEDNVDAQFCGGSLIGSKYVLTAAHCIRPSATPDKIEVLTYSQSLESGGVRQSVRRFWRHPEFNGFSPANDIAVIEMDVSVAVGIPTNQPIRKKLEDEYIVPGRKGFVTGWGGTNYPGSSYPTELQEVKVPIVNRAKCKKSYPDFTFDKRMICAGYKKGGRGFCDGDSGGPLVVRQNGNWRLQIGVVSASQGCALPGRYEIYTNVAKYMKWINIIIK